MLMARLSCGISVAMICCGWLPQAYRVHGKHGHYPELGLLMDVAGYIQSPSFTSGHLFCHIVLVIGLVLSTRVPGPVFVSLASFNSSTL